MNMMKDYGCCGKILTRITVRLSVSYHTNYTEKSEHIQVVGGFGKNIVLQYKCRR